MKDASFGMAFFAVSARTKADTGRSLGDDA